MKLDIAAAALRSRRTQFARRQVEPVAPTESELVAATRFAVVLQPDPEPHGRAVVEHAFPTDIARVGKRGVHQVARDERASQMRGRVEVVVDDVHMPPERAILAATVSAEVELVVYVAEYPSPAGDEVARDRNEVEGSSKAPQNRSAVLQRVALGCRIA